jgi:endonuclease/exonuclease/phosphatase family metal-dependent hydrolase
MSLHIKNSVAAIKWDRVCLDLSSKMAEPFCGAWHLVRFRLIAPLDPKKFENQTKITHEIGVRTLIGLGTVLGSTLFYMQPTPLLSFIVVLGLASKLLRAIGFSIQKKEFTHIQTSREEKVLNSQNPEMKIMSWNICGIGGGLSLDHGGVIHWKSRLNALVEKIKNEDPDVLILQEVYDGALAEALVKNLESEFSHFFIHLGPNVWGSIGGCMILSKCALHHFSHSSFKNNDWTLNRGIAHLEIKKNPKDPLPWIRILGTHLIHGNAPKDKANRLEQIGQIVDHVATQKLSIPTILAGDLNIERDAEEGKTLSSFFLHSYEGVKPTCTNRLTFQWDAKEKVVWEETIDYISLLKSDIPSEEKVILEDTHLIEAFDESYNTKTALSDHHALSTKVRKP